MSAGTLVGLIVTLLGAIAGGALAAVAAGLIAVASQSELWVIFISCFGGGLLLSLWLAPHPAAVLRASGFFALLLGLACGGLALAATLGMALISTGASRASLWALFLLCLPAGLILVYSAGALASRQG